MIQPQNLFSAKLFDDGCANSLNAAAANGYCALMGGEVTPQAPSLLQQRQISITNYNNISTTRVNGSQIVGQQLVFTPSKVLRQ
jgi:hypothetical protein